MITRRRALELLAGAASAGLVCTSPVFAQAVDGGLDGRIAEEGLDRSQVMETASWLSDRIGSRLTNSPGMRAAEQWTLAQFKRWKLRDVHAEPFDFGRGWSFDRASIRMIEPRSRALSIIPIAWTPGFDRPVQHGVIVAPIAKDADLARWTGKLAGKIVLISAPKVVSPLTAPPVHIYDDAELRALEAPYTPETRQSDYAADMTARLFAERLDAFLAREGAVAWIRKSYRDGELVHGDTGYGAGYRVGRSRAVPGFEMAAEDYLRIVRLEESGAPVVLEIDSSVRFHDGDHNANNIIADIPGTDPDGHYVMAGAHLDSWIAGDGAADNGAGVAIVMEAARILSTLKVKPRRTIRFALWAAEEQGGLGSLAYIERHIATRPGQTVPGAAPSWAWSRRFPISPKPGFDRIDAYFNVDKGSGAIRGIFTEGNREVVPIFRQMLNRFAAFGASSVASGPAEGSDHSDFQSLGLPAFQFIQDPLDYESRVHHSNLDTFDHLAPLALRRNAVILATVLMETANREEALPRRPMPTGIGSKQQ
ncbi:M20/M25/M40 family metallo-hydrolase [Rhizorhabdus dicambivorans]|uniref:Carboxypeptidase Q n=1 Tax=Rhizorhabdus dicambivorans TaxID=1850238 RepID=A0A2A4FX31_9SPHN|nr:M20/M25/M40 family metallo-hydrolase [Rhizorhabdus dicambivorans]ATE63614.1 peptidase M28 [Rhizorhabdus dicambivorans]PCE42740.1 peptidase M28 [Rhizorhabdus dicambivorans]